MKEEIIKIELDRLNLSNQKDFNRFKEMFSNHKESIGRGLTDLFRNKLSDSIVETLKNFFKQGHCEFPENFKEKDPYKMESLDEVSSYYFELFAKLCHHTQE